MGVSGLWLFSVLILIRKLLLVPTVSKPKQVYNLVYNLGVQLKNPRARNISRISKSCKRKRAGKRLFVSRLPHVCVVRTLIKTGYERDKLLTAFRRILVSCFQNTLTWRKNFHTNSKKVNTTFFLRTFL